jgi:hypothetical protein
VRLLAALTAALALSLAGSAHAAPRCYGAAARDPHKHCAKEAKTVTPTPDEAAITPNIACTRAEVGDMATSCAVGAPAETALATVAMLGDSHAAHWRATMEAVALRKKWRVLEIARPHCPFSFASPAPTEAGAGDCVSWNQRIIDWLAANPSVSTVFISDNARLPMAQRDFAYRLDGFLRAFRALPATVTRAIVLRDPPTDRATSDDCVTRAVKRHRAPGSHCALPRSRALVRDSGITAAQQLGGRFTTVDLTKFFCDRKRCFPVVGGVLVHKDVDHLTQDFAATLGPYLLRAIGG